MKFKILPLQKTEYIAWANFRNVWLFYQVTLGTNPINMAAPAKDGDSFVLDMATTSVALGKVCM